MQITAVNAGSTDNESLKNSGSDAAADECFESASRVMFKINHGLDKAIFEPVAKGYRALPVPIRKGTGNVVNNLRSLLTFSNKVSSVFASMVYPVFVFFVFGTPICSISTFDNC